MTTEALARALERSSRRSRSAIAEANARIDEYFRDMLAFDRPVTQWPDEQLHPETDPGRSAATREWLPSCCCTERGWP